MSDLADPTPATAAILPFPGARRSRAAVPADECGRILLFTGVRYERMAEAGRDADPRPTRPPRRRRSGGAARLKRQS